MFVNKMHALWGLTMSLRAPKVPSAWECRPAPEAVAYSRRQARFSLRRRTACRRCPIRSHIPKSTLDAKHSAIFHLSIAWMRPITTIYFTALTECHTKLAPWHALPEDNRALLVFGGAKCCCATAKCRLCFRARQPNRLRNGSQLDQGTAVPTGQRASGGQVVKFPTGAEGKRLQISRGVISASRCLTANALAVNRSPVVLPTDESWCDA